jgi:hypothetical protein
MTRSHTRERVAKAFVEEKQPDLSIGDETDKININDSTNIEGTYEFYGVYNTQNWDSLYHFVLYLKIESDSQIIEIIKISHVEAGKNLIKIITQEMYEEDIEDKTLLDKGKFKCKKSDIYKRSLSLWANSDNIYKISKQFPSSCSGFVLSVLIFISDEFCIKLIKFNKQKEEKGLKQFSLERAIWEIGKTDGLSNIYAEDSDIKIYENEIKKLRMFDFKYKDYNKDIWKEIVYLYNLKKNNNQKDYIYKKYLYLHSKQQKQTLPMTKSKSATKSLTKSLTKSTSKTGKVTTIQPMSKKLPMTKSPINKTKEKTRPSVKRSLKLGFNPKNKSKNKKSLKKKSKKLRKSKN